MFIYYKDLIVSMNEKYYLALFNEETWNEFLENGLSAYGTNLNKQVRMQRINIDDFLICYVTKLSRFVGLLKVTSKPYINNTIIWKNEVYPVRVDVHPEYILKHTEGVTLSGLKDELTIFNNLKNPNSWKIFFRNSLNTFQEHDAKIIIEKLKEASNE